MSNTVTATLFRSLDVAKLPPAVSGIKRVVEHGQILRAPLHRPRGTTGDVSYELGCCVQLDASHCLLIASMDEQGGGDLCVGNDGFVFQQLSDIMPERAIPINRVDPHYQLKSGHGEVLLAKFPGPAGFIPLGTMLEDGRPHPGAGTGFFWSGCVSKQGKGASMEPESPFELVQLGWDGQSLSVSPGVLIDELLGMELGGNTSITNACPSGESLLLPIGVGDQISVFQFDWDGERWAATRHGELFATNPGRPAIPGEEHKHSPGELEPSLQRQGDRYLLHTRGLDPVGRLYESNDGMKFDLILETPNHTVPQVLNIGLDGNVYLATNPGPGMIRNPLLAHCLEGDRWADPIVIHDQEGIRGDKGDKIPFVDHAIAANVFLEGRWRHLIFFRVCDLKERTLHTFQINQGMDKELFGGQGPLSTKRSASGLYLTEFEYE